MNKIFPFCLLLLCACQRDLAPVVSCQPQTEKTVLNSSELIRAFDDQIIRRLAAGNIPDASGALSRNKDAYFHVRFQMGIAQLADYATGQQLLPELEMLIKAIEYSYQHQRSSGDFEIAVPASLASQGTPSAGDLASGTAFFLSSLGTALQSLRESAWFTQSASTATHRQRIAVLIPQMQRSLDFLKQQQNLLLTYDAGAPNRLLFDALAFYTLGTYLNDETAKQTGIDFAQKALALQNASGFFIENSGYDSSYQGVALAVGFRLYVVLPLDEPFRKKLWQSLCCGNEWQASRVLASGEISAQGNTRVYPGGEKFLGEEKTIAWISTLQSFLSMYYHTGNPKYQELAQRLIEYYG